MRTTRSGRRRWSTRRGPRSTTATTSPDGLESVADTTPAAGRTELGYNPDGTIDTVTRPTDPAAGTGPTKAFALLAALAVMVAIAVAVRDLLIGVVAVTIPLLPLAGIVVDSRTTRGTTGQAIGISILVILLLTLIIGSISLILRVIGE